MKIMNVLEVLDDFDLIQMISDFDVEEMKALDPFHRVMVVL
jgi:hypothetical protein